jgi:hypothetical protein
VGGDQIKELSFFPGMNVSSEKKIKVFKNVIEQIAKKNDLIKMSLHCANTVSNMKVMKIK